MLCVDFLELPDEVLEGILMACDPYSAIALSRTCRSLNARMNEQFWRDYSEPMRRRNRLPGDHIDTIYERSYLEYVTARAKAGSVDYGG